MRISLLEEPVIVGNSNHIEMKSLMFIAFLLSNICHVIKNQQCTDRSLELSNKIIAQ